MARIPLLEFSGGMNRKATTLIQNDNEGELLVNFSLDKVGALTKRLGYSQYGTVSGGTSLSGISPYYQSNGSVALIGIIGTSLYNFGTGAVIDNTFTSGIKYEFEPFLNQIFIVGSNGNTFATSKNLSGNTVSSTNLTGAPKAKYAKVFRDQMYFINC